MQYTIRALTQKDVPFLWDMLFYAAHMEADGATSSEAAKRNPFLAQYVTDWGRRGDLGLVAIDTPTQRRWGAVWVRLLSQDKSSASYYDDETPELSIAVLPEVIGKGMGTALMQQLLEAAELQHPAVVLTVRATNPAARLYERLGFVVIDEIVNRVGTKSYKMLIRFDRTGERWCLARGRAT
jgi:ribosomal protein S18 acetylase RimI-like enzyme